jgi:hypothetical protein
VETWARLGTRILIVDPITAANEVGDKSWKEETAVHDAGEGRGGANRVLGDPRYSSLEWGQAGKPSLSGAAGRHGLRSVSADNMLWLRHYDQPKEVTVGLGITASSMMIDSLFRDQEGP